ncbi:MAG: diguanylate cyclase [Gammaproteobacteria bacterium]|nr:diguanylate cyclase [Gammaproteobacteria bacterium]
MAANDLEWKTKYLSSLDKLENMEKHWNEVEELLRLGITRVALAAQGVDSKLDKQLNSLRKAIRSGKNYEALSTIVDDISNSVKRIDEQRKNDTVDSRPSTLLLRLINALSLPNTDKHRLKTIQKKLKKADDSLPLDNILRELAELINDALKPEDSTKNDPKNSLLSRLFDFNTEPKIPNTLPHTIDSETPITNRGSNAPPKPNNTTVLFIEFITYLAKTGLHDPELLNLEQIIRQHDDPDTMHEHVKQLAQFISQKINPNETTQAITFGANMLQQTLAALNLAETQPQRTNALLAKLSNAQQKTELDTLCEEIAALTVRVLVHPASEANTNVSIDEQPGICNFSLQLLDSLNFPVELRHQVTQLRDQLILGVPIIDTPKILNGIADLVTLTRSKLEQEKQDLQDFLHQLTQNLQDIDKHIAGAQSQRAAAVLSNEQFDNTFNAHVKDIRASLEDISDPKQLKLIIRERVDTIRDHVVHHSDSEIARHKQLEAELTKTNTRLKELEMESQQLRQRLIEEHAHAIRDPLTGMFNRLAYEERITQEYSRWKRYQTPLSLLIFDIDHFKRINDTYGHKAGDKALKLISKCLQSNIRESDFIARFGGEEFVAIMPETTIKAAIEAANKLRQTIENNQFHYEGKDVRITISCGAAQFQKNDSIDSTFQRADKSLYVCKHQGRNCCHSSDI